MSVAMHTAAFGSATLSSRRPRPRVEAPASRWNLGRLKLAGQGLALSYVLWACIYAQMPSLGESPAVQVSAPAVVSAAAS